MGYSGARAALPGNHDRNLLFGLLTDFGDADQQSIPGDEEAIDYASTASTA
jgi:hypothetical protein